MKNKERKNSTYNVYICTFLLFITTGSFAQCPTDLADLEDGGTFSGNCTIDLDANYNGTLTIDGDVIWTSGTLTIENSRGGRRLNVVINGFVDIQGGTWDLDDGSLTINEDGELKTAAGTSVEVNANGRGITVNGGVLNAEGSLSIDGDFIVEDGADVDISGEVEVGENLEISGNGTTFNLEDGADVSVNNSVEVAGDAAAVFGSGSEISMGVDLIVEDATLEIAGKVEKIGGGGNDDIELYGDAIIIVNDGADVSGFQDIEFEGNDGDASLIINGGSISIDQDIDFNDTEQNVSIVVNGGTLEAGGDIDLDDTNGSITVNPGGSLIADEIDGDQPTDPADLPEQIVIDGGSVYIGEVPLPVVLTSFTAKYDMTANQCVLNWKTASEINNYGFYIERSSSSDGIFETIGFVEGNGSTSAFHSYQYRCDCEASLTYFRLRQGDYDGVFEYSPVVTASKSNMVNNSYSVHPNPTSGEIKLTGFTEEIMQAKVFSMSGEETCIVEGNSTSIELEAQLSECLKEQKNGTYILYFQSSDNHYQTLLIKN